MLELGKRWVTLERREMQVGVHVGKQRFREKKAVD